MTAGGINQIIAQLRADKRTSAIVVCPICEGGSRRRRTLSVDLRDGVWLYLCHRASCPTKGAIPVQGDDGKLLMESTRAFTPRQMLAPLRLPEPGDPIADRVLPLLDGTALTPFSLCQGLRVCLKDPSTHVWIVRNVKEAVLGHVTRTTDKRMLTYRAVDAPFYGFYLGCPSTPCVAVVEDPLSAALLADDGINAICLHGTNLSREAAAEIVSELDDSTTYWIALDPDEAGRTATQMVGDRLRAAGSRRTWWWPLSKDVNKMSIQERRALVAELLRGG